MRDNRRKVLVERNCNLITFHSFSYPRIVSQLVMTIESGVREGFGEFVLHFSETHAVYPNTIVPVFAIIEYYQKERGVNFNYAESKDVVFSSNFKPRSIPENNFELGKPIGKVWRFNKDSYFEIHRAIINELRKADVFGQGVFEAIEWALWEVMDNVFVHSLSEEGYVMCQIHPTTKLVVLEVFDTGQGMYNSLINSIHHPRNEVDAITKCLEEGVTRDSSVGQGNGLTGLYNLIKNGNGILTITSGRGYFKYFEGEIHTAMSVKPLTDERQCTSVDFQIDYSKNVSISEIMTFQGKTFEIDNPYLDRLLNENDQIVYKVVDHYEGSGTREAAKRMKTELMNLYQQSHVVLILDFDGVSITSSSFADELISKLVLEIGFFQYNNIFRMKNMNPQVQQILQKSVIQRMVTSFENKEADGLTD